MARPRLPTCSSTANAFSRVSYPWSFAFPSSAVLPPACSPFSTPENPPLFLVRIFSPKNLLPTEKFFPPLWFCAAQHVSFPSFFGFRQSFTCRPIDLLSPRRRTSVSAARDDPPSSPPLHAAPKEDPFARSIPRIRSV